MLGLDKLLDDQEPSAGVAGEWFTVQWTPDTAAGERLNIGVGFISEDGERSFRLLDDFSRLACLYDGAADFHAQLACRVAQEVISSGEFELDSAYRNLRFERRGFAQGADQGRIVDRLYREAMTLARERSGRRKQFAPVAVDSAYARLKPQLKRSLALDYQRHVPENPYTQVRDAFGSESLYLPFRRDDGVATLASAAYADPYRVKCHLFDGFRAVDTAITKQMTKDGAVFLILPGDGLKKEVKTELENQIDKFYAFLQRHKIYMESHEDVGVLGEEIAEWCRAA